jgi:predicted nucleic acid-binding protein
MFVLDTTTVMDWIWRKDSTGYADAVLGRLEKERAKVHGGWFMELAEALANAERQGIAVAQVERYRELVLRLPIEIDSPRRDAWVERVLMLGRQHGINVAQASNLELAMREGLPIGSIDAELRRAAETVGVEILEVRDDDD